MLWTASKKQILFTALVIAIIALPILMLSSPGNSLVQRWIDGHKDSPKAPGLQLTLAKIYRYTLRTEREVDAYGKYLNYFSATASPKNYDPVKYKHTAYLWCVRGEDLETGTQVKLDRYFWFLRMYRDTMSDDPEIQQAERRYQQLGGPSVYNGWP